MDTRKSLGMVFRCISMDLGRTLTFNINFRPPPPSEGPPFWAGSPTPPLRESLRYNLPCTKLHMHEVDPALCES